MSLWAEQGGCFFVCVFGVDKNDTWSRAREDGQGSGVVDKHACDLLIRWSVSRSRPRSALKAVTRQASAMLSAPVRRCMFRTVFRRLAMTCGAVPVCTVERCRRSALAARGDLTS